jgi:hypothetical protein
VFNLELKLYILSSKDLAAAPNKKNQVIMWQDGKGGVQGQDRFCFLFFRVM